LATRLGGRLELKVACPGPESPLLSGTRELASAGYTFGGMLGRSCINRGFVILAAERGSERYAVKLTDERRGEGIMEDVLSREFEALRQVCHPNIVRTFGLIEVGSGVALIMERCPGRQLRSALPLETGLAIERRASVLEQILGAVAHLHEAGIAHMDLQASNIMIDEAPCEDVGVKVVDFGSSRRVDDSSDEALTPPCIAFGAAGGQMSDVDPRILPPGGADDHGLRPNTEFSADMFASGLIMAGLAAGSEVFVDRAFPGRRLTLPASVRERLCSAALQLQRDLLSLEPDGRPDAQSALDSLRSSGLWCRHGQVLGARSATETKFD
jgi:serine/threonine protein kinase